MIITDLDGTLLKDDKTVSRKDLNTLLRLKHLGIIRVAATGRNLHSIKQVLPEDFPVDFIIFSSGAGIIDWHTKKIIHANYLSGSQIDHIKSVLHSMKVSYMIQHPIPDNHFFSFYEDTFVTKDFLNRRIQYSDFATSLHEQKYPYTTATQFLVILTAMEMFEKLEAHLSNVEIIRATSPMDHQSIWMEIFPQDISKGHTCEWLCNYLQLDPAKTLAIGNDYNDMHMLHWAADSYVLENAPDELKKQFKVSESNQNSGFSKAVELGGHSVVIR